jgi:hypothetical protein
VVNNVTSTPSPGIRRLNGVGGAGSDVDLISSDSSILITPNAVTKQIDLQVLVNTGIVIPDVVCDSSVYVGAMVYIAADNKAYNALAVGLTSSNVIGLVEAKPTPTTALVRCSGVSSALYSLLDPTKEYFLSDLVSGGITTTPPTISGHIMLKVGQPFSNTTFLFNKKDRFIRG